MYASCGLLKLQYVKLRGIPCVPNYFINIYDTKL